jgi:hypothetical protein
MVLPSAVALVLSVGVVTANREDFVEGEGVRTRIVALLGVTEGCAVNGKGIFCVARNEREERIWTTEVGMKVGCG